MGFYSDEQYMQWLDQLASEDHVIIDHFISAETHQLLLDFFFQLKAEDDLKKAGIGALGNHTVLESVRGDYIYWLDKSRDQHLTPFYEQLDELIGWLKRYCFLSISDFECHLAYYPPETFYKRHSDQFKERSNRLVSFVIYLTPEWQKPDAGELVLYRDNETTTISPVPCRLALFKSHIEHEVLKTNAGRYSLTGWMLNQPVGLGYIY